MNQDGATLYLPPDLAGIGATIDRAGPDVRHVVICGSRPACGVRTWANATGRWFHTAVPYVAGSTLRASLAADGRTVRVTRAASWFGEGVTPDDAAEAMRVVRHVVGRYRVPVVGSPGSTGMAMLRSDVERWPSVSAAVGDLLRATSGQGRFQCWPDVAAVATGPLVKVDARFQYAALAGLELPVGEPVEVDGDVPEWAASWCEVEFSPRSAAGGWLGVWDDRRGGSWTWPTGGGPYRTWCTGAELQAARRDGGYRVEVVRALVWERKARPLAKWANHLVKSREHIDTLPISAGVRAAARAGVRSILVQTIGQMHGRPTERQHTAADSADIPTGAGAVRLHRASGQWVYTMPGEPVAGAHPEWTTAIWGTARVRLARQMARQTAPVIGCALDAFYVAGSPVVDDDDGRPGRWRIAGQWSEWAAPTRLADLYQMGAAA